MKIEKVIKTDGKKVYSPKIKKEFIPILYEKAKEKEIHMTDLVNSIIETYLKAGENAVKYGVKAAKDVAEYAKQNLPDNEQEYFMILHLDSKNKVKKHEIVSKGILNASIVHPREVFKKAIKENDNAIILVHNHPSGDPTPSEEDDRITDIIHQAGEIIGISVLDHVVLGNAPYNNYYSYREERKI